MYSDMRSSSNTVCCAASIICFVVFASAGAEAQDKAQAIDCLSPSQVVAAGEAYEAYCARCHKPENLARKWFSLRGTGEDAVNALAVFLDSHGSCPHNHHEVLARWLAEKADGN
ncbi:hypothetical protein [Anderseniella sp. Alg231-50]|uniref:hypothetical protein n=1 Tax=Anderseniella sp. Alg231-50 TaxID=1922226 RepID=UPI000D55A02F